MPSLGMSKETPSRLKPLDPSWSSFPFTHAGVITIATPTSVCSCFPCAFSILFTLTFFSRNSTMTKPRYQGVHVKMIQRSLRTQRVVKKVPLHSRRSPWSYPLLRSSLKSHRVSATSLDSRRPRNPATFPTLFANRTRPRPRPRTSLTSIDNRLFANSASVLRSTSGCSFEYVFELRKNTSSFSSSFFVFFVDVAAIRQAP